MFLPIGESSSGHHGNLPHCAAGTDCSITHYCYNTVVYIHAASHSAALLSCAVSHSSYSIHPSTPKSPWRRRKRRLPPFSLRLTRRRREAGWLRRHPNDLGSTFERSEHQTRKNPFFSLLLRPSIAVTPVCIDCPVKGGRTVLGLFAHCTRSRNWILDRKGRFRLFSSGRALSTSPVRGRNGTKTRERDDFPRYVPRVHTERM